MKFLLLACFLAAVCAPMAWGSLIVGGYESNPNSRPYQVALFDYANAESAWFFCGGTLVHESWIVCAAHCSGGTVYVGLGYHDKTVHGTSGQAYISGTWYTHSRYNSNTLDNDISLIKLASPVSLGGDIQSIGITSTAPSDGESLLVSGWGTEYSGAWDTPDKLREVVVSKTNQASCNSDYGGEITDNMFCAGEEGGGKDACQGDSGGPIVSNYGASSHSTGTLLEGIVSWGYGCASASYPGVYTNVANYCNWIRTTTSSAVTCA